MHTAPQEWWGGETDDQGSFPGCSFPQGTLGEVWGHLCLLRLGDSWHQRGGARKAAPPCTEPRMCTTPWSPPFYGILRGPTLAQRSQRPLTSLTQDHTWRQAREALRVVKYPARPSDTQVTLLSAGLSLPRKGGKGVYGSLRKRKHPEEHFASVSEHGHQGSGESCPRESCWPPANGEGSEGLLPLRKHALLWLHPPFPPDSWPLASLKKQGLRSEHQTTRVPPCETEGSCHHHQLGPPCLRARVRASSSQSSGDFSAQALQHG